MISFYRAINAIKACALVCVFQAPVFATVSAQVARAQVETKKRAFALTHAANGELIRTPAARALPGQILEYELSYRNMSDVALDDFILVGELPIAAEYVSNAALNGPKAVFEVSVADMGWVLPPVVRYMDDGKGILRPVAIPEENFQALRWRLAESIAPGEEVSASYRIKITK